MYGEAQYFQNIYLCEMRSIDHALLNHRTVFQLVQPTHIQGKLSTMSGLAMALPTNNNNNNIQMEDQRPVKVIYVIPLKRF